MFNGRLDKYLYICKTRMIRSFTYKFEVYGNILMQSIIMITTAFFWKALFGNETFENGEGSLRDMGTSI